MASKKIKKGCYVSTAYGFGVVRNQERKGYDVLLDQPVMHQGRGTCRLFVHNLDIIEMVNYPKFLEIIHGKIQ